MLSATDIRLAQQRIRDRLTPTPLIEAHGLSEELGCTVLLKLEQSNPTGSFKVRGVFNKLLSLSAEELSAGVVAYSGGNHARAVAYASRLLKIPARVHMPETASPASIQATRDDGAEVVLAANAALALERAISEKDQGRIFVHPYDDPMVWAGQGTIGLELLSQAPNLSAVFVSIGGGGLITGITTALHDARPGIRVFGVETVGADTMRQSLEVGHSIRLTHPTSIAKTLTAPTVSEYALQICQHQLRALEVVSDDEALHDLRVLLEDCKLLTEPAASCTLSALRRRRQEFSKDDQVVLVMCGGNVSIPELQPWLEARASKETA